MISVTTSQSIASKGINSFQLFSNKRNSAFLPIQSVLCVTEAVVKHKLLSHAAGANSNTTFLEQPLTTVAAHTNYNHLL